LSQALEHAKASRGQVIAVVGEPGVGKSRLYYEFIHSHRVQDCLVIESVSVSYGKATAYLPVIELLRHYFRIEDRDDARIVREKVTGRLLSLDRTLEPFMAALLWLLDVSADDPKWEHLDPPQRRQQTLDGVKRLLLRESQVRPVVVLFEDLHWIDVETQALVDALVESLPAARVLLLVNYRPEYRHGWGSKTYYRQLRIDPLPAASAHELLDALLGHDSTVQPLKAVLVQRTEGTPFFLEESVRTLVETKVLVGDRGGYRLQRPLSTIEVPATVKALLAARIDRLQAEEKAVLQAASVIGTDVPFGLLQAIADIPDEQLRHRLVQLQSAEFLYETNLFPELQHTFKHALTHEVAYGTLLGDRRRALHARIVETIERLYADRLSEQVEQLAHHAVKGEIWGPAVRYLHEAGAKAFRRSSNVEAIAYFTHGLELAGRLPPGREQVRQELGLLLALGPALQMTRGFGVPEVERTYSRARELCEQLGEPVELFQALWGLWLHTAGRGRFEAARRLAEELLTVAGRFGDRTLLLEAHHAMCPSTLWVGDPEGTRRHGEHGMTLYDREQHRSLAFVYGGHDPGVCCRMHAGLALWFLGYQSSALERSRNGLALATELAHLGSIVNALPFVAIVHQLRRDVEAAREVSESLIALSTEHGFQQWLAFGRVLEGWAQAQEGRGDSLTARLRRDIGAYSATGNELYGPYFLSLLAATQLKYGEATKGLDTIVEAQKMADETGVRLMDPELHRLKGELLLASGPAAEAEAEIAFRQAIDIARLQSAKSWELRAALSLGRLWQRQGKRDEVAQLLNGIHDWFTEGFDTADLRDARTLLDELSRASR
jgi:predicted ATPase